MTPKYKHDCKSCIFLGNYNDHDLYYCLRDATHTVIARYGDGPSEYHSGWAFKDQYEVLAVAYAILRFRLRRDKP